MLFYRQDGENIIFHCPTASAAKTETDGFSRPVSVLPPGPVTVGQRNLAIQDNSYWLFRSSLWKVNSFDVSGSTDFIAFAVFATFFILRASRSSDSSPTEQFSLKYSDPCFISGQLEMYLPTHKLQATYSISLKFCPPLFICHTYPGLILFDFKVIFFISNNIFQLEK